MLEAINKAKGGPVWAFLVRVATLLDIPVSPAELESRLIEAGAHKKLIVSALAEAMDGKDPYGFLRAAFDPNGSDPRWWNVEDLWSVLQRYLYTPSWSNAVDLARALRPCESDELVAACLVAALTAAHRAAIRGQ